MQEDGLVLVVNSIGIPVLVRSYGQAQVPATAALGIVSTIFHAALDSEKQVQHLETSQHRIVYRQTKDGLLLVLFHSGVVPRHQGEKTLMWLDRVIHLVLRPSLIASTDAGLQKFELAKHFGLLDYVMTHHGDLELGLEMPLTTLASLTPSASLGISWRGPMFIIMDSVILVEDRCDASFDGWLVVLLIVVAELILEQPTKTWCHTTPVYIHEVYRFNTTGVDLASQILHHVVAVQSKHLVWFGLSKVETSPKSVEAIQVILNGRLSQDDHLPRPWDIPSTVLGHSPSLLGYCIFRQRPSHRCHALVGIQPTDKLAQHLPGTKKHVPRTRLQVYTLLSHYVQQWRLPEDSIQDHMLTTEDMIVVHSVRPPLSLVYIVAGSRMHVTNAIAVGDRLAQHVFGS
ncbi:Aste57867_21455 [Aphanomyces stellatus]|uniref:Aste57867_21455 protein n=1 Tax=Aphanomyces stellatus TaxID=120398 RepID=A0A485LHL1_9STRA|nr:hypothetical protein As57867_021386 [Aphanomyces stellatus]VFT98126.1 Aste57867_21455 [Aphanomyces stellatus]